MSQCLRCSKLCEATAVFCDECRSLLRYQFQHRPSLSDSQESSPSTASTLVNYPTLPELGDAQYDPLERITSPLPNSRVNQTSQPPELTAQADLVEQAASKLSEAAQLIEQEEELEAGKSERKARLYSRSSRLAPIRDISADIRRESTPLPQISSTQQSKPASKNGLGQKLNNGNSPAHFDSGSGMPDLWPWLDSETEDKDSDSWANHTDPLISRHFPNSAESARIEEEDIRRAMAERVPTTPYPTPRTFRHLSRARVAFIAIAIFALVVLAVDGILLASVAFDHSHHADRTPVGPPSLTLSQNSASTGQTIQLIIQHFKSSTSVALTHDIQEPIQVAKGSSFITVDSTGAAKVPLFIDNDWGPGFHLIVAEDVTTRYTASATLQITGKGPTPPPHLLIDARPLSLGAEVVGANTIHPFMLTNSGGGAITWSASSNKSWLLVSPSQGMFSQNQTILIAAQRVGLRPGDYTGTLTISSNVSPTMQIEVNMSVRPLPPNAGPVIALSPALLTFTTTDGDSKAMVQDLTISNPGSRTLDWMLSINSQATTTTQLAAMHTPVPNCNWLGAAPLSGTVLPGATRSIKVLVQSQCMLPGTYEGTLLFTSTSGSYDGPQSAVVSLTVQPHCGIITSSGFMAFTAVQGQGNPANQTLSLNATVSCAGATINWSTTTTASWLALTPAGGQLKGTASTVVSVNVNVSGLVPNPKPYIGIISFLSGMSTQSIVIQLTVQAKPSSTEPIMGVSPLNLNFSNTQGQPNPVGQVVTITNNGGGMLRWNESVNCLSFSCWLVATPSGGVIAPGQTGQVTLSVMTASLTPGNYVGQITLNGFDAKNAPAAGSPQTLMINLVVQPPCSISPPSSSSLSFSAVQGAPSPTAQTVTFTGTGSCVWPLTWNAQVVKPGARWLTLTPGNGSVKGTGQSGSIVVSANVTGRKAGTYTTPVIISATDASGGAVQGSQETFFVTLTILPPCVLSSLPPSLQFTILQGQPAPPTQNVPLSEAGTCARPVTWTASTSGSTWLILSATSGTDSGSGSTLSVGINPTKMVPGMYAGQITINATDSSGAPVIGSPQIIPVSLIVMGFTVSGTVTACSGPAPSCTSSHPLAGATVTLMGGSTTLTVVADASGNYSFSGVALGTYTISAAGSDTNTLHYIGSTALTVVGDTSGVNIQAFPG